MVVEHLRAAPPRAPAEASKPDQPDWYLMGYDEGRAQAARDISITHAHRTALRRIIAGEPIGDLAHVLGSLYLHELVDDDMVNRQPFVTPLGIELLAAHDRLAATVRRERPRLTSRPLPPRWSAHLFEVGPVWKHETEAEGVLVSADHGDGDWLTVALADYGTLGELLLKARDVVALLEHIQHERAVRAQDGAS